MKNVASCRDVYQSMQNPGLNLSIIALAFKKTCFRLHLPMIAVGSDDTNTMNGAKVFIYEYSESSRRWMKAETLSGITDAVHDIAFAPNLGRNFHTLAIATKDVRIVTLKPTGQV
jgi:hypothetical protein